MKEASPLMHNYSKVRSPAPMRSCANKKTRGFSKLFSAPTQPGWGLFLGSIKYDAAVGVDGDDNSGGEYQRERES